MPIQRPIYRKLNDTCYRQVRKRTHSIRKPSTWTKDLHLHWPQRVASSVQLMMECHCQAWPAMRRAAAGFAGRSLLGQTIFGDSDCDSQEDAAISKSTANGLLWLALFGSSLNEHQFLHFPRITHCWTNSSEHTSKPEACCV